MMFTPPEAAETVVTTITINGSEVPESQPLNEDELVEVADEDEVTPDLTADAVESIARTAVVALVEPAQLTAPELEPVSEPEPVVEPEPEPAVDENLRAVFQPERDSEAPEEATALAELDNSTDIETMPEETVDWTEESGQNEDASTDEAPEDIALSELSPSENQEESDTLEESALVEQIAANSDEETVAWGDEDGSVEENLEAVDVVEARDEQLAVQELPEPEDSGIAEQIDGPGPARVTSPLDRFRPQYALAVARQSAQDGRPLVIARGATDGDDEAAYRDVFGERDERDSERVAAEAREASLVGDHDALWEHTRHALENYDVSVTPGSEISLNTRSDEAAGYIHYLHNKIHERWWAYLSQWDLYAGATSPLSDYSLVVELEFGIGRDGEVDQVSIANGSGTALFDGPAIGLLWDIGPHRPPPPGLIGGDGNAYVRWSFHRDNRGCISSGASVRRVQVSEGEGG
jgi:hypothetical protein